VPVVVGAPNIRDFAPGPNTVLHIKTLDDVSLVASQMKHLAKNETAFKEATR
jgi:glycoprotein 3-alpha-L-fucosyltransferase